MWRSVITAAAFGLASLPAQACDLALALAVDVSGSVDSREYGIQMQGLAHALRDPIISEALVRGDSRLMLVQWTGASRQQVTIPWTRIDSFDAIDAFAVAVDFMDKNKEKISAPKGSEGGRGGFSSMY